MIKDILKIYMKINHIYYILISILLLIFSFNILPVKINTDSLTNFQKKCYPEKKNK